MTLSGNLVTGSLWRAAAQKIEYLQIITVKCREREQYIREYIRCCHDHSDKEEEEVGHVVFFELPETANVLGIGAARYHMKRLATSICPADFPISFFLDDSVHYWKGITLPGDPEPMFGECADDAATLTDISLADVLMHFQSEQFASDLHQFGLIGFHRIDGYNQSKAAYSRQHVYSAIIMNLDKLRDVDYSKECFLWEDLDFNKRASEAGAVLCKCYRFGMAKKPGMPGGCSDMVSRRDEAEAGGGHVAHRLADLNVEQMSRLVKRLLSEKYPRNPDLAALVADIFASTLQCGQCFLDATEASLADIGIRLQQRTFLLTKRAELVGESGIPKGLLE
jgi:hypothetical protein